MNTNAAASLCCRRPTESPIRHPDTINIPWPEELHFRKGSPKNLCGIEVYHDFDWASVIGHNNAHLRNGKSLANRAKHDCPPDKTPALLLSTLDEVKVGGIQTERYYILVAYIHEYVNQSRGDVATDYYAGKLKGNMTKGGYVTGIEDPLAPEVVETLIDNHLDLSAIARWAHGNPNRLEQLKGIVPTDRTTPAEPASILEIIEALESLDHINEKHVNAILVVLQELGASGFSSILEWVLESEDVVKHLARLGVHSLERLNSVTGIARLKEVLSFWKANKNSSDEEFWQKTLEKNAFVLSQVFSFAVVILKGKAYVGGKGIDNTGGNIVDFLCANGITRNAVLIEIKTPVTTLLSAKPYRGDVYNVQAELSGAVMQVSNDKYWVTKKCNDSSRNSGLDYEEFNPQCLVIAGNTEQFTDHTQLKSFELFRSGLKDVQVVTYDELFNKIQVLVSLLEGSDGEETKRASLSDSSAIEVPQSQQG